MKFPRQLLSGLLLAAIAATCVARSDPPRAHLLPVTQPTPTAVFESPATPSATPNFTPSPRLIPTRDPGVTPVPVAPCQMLSSLEAAAVLGEPAADPLATRGGCIFLDNASGRHVLSVFMLPPEESRDTIRGHALLLGAWGAQVTTAQADSLATLGSERDMLGVIEGIAQLAGGQGAAAAERLDDLGDGAIWVSKAQGAVRQGFMLIARSGHLVGLDMVVTIGRDADSMKAGATFAAGQVLSRLPEYFTLAAQPATGTPTREPLTLQPSLSPGLTLAESATALPTAALASTATSIPAAGSPTPVPTVKPPAFSVPIISNPLVGYGGPCAPNLVTISVKVVDPSGLSGIATVAIVARLVDDAESSEWKATPMRAEGSEVWLQTLIVERDLIGYQAFTEAQVEFYFLATNNNGVSAESPHYGLEPEPLVLRACTTATP